MARRKKTYAMYKGDEFVDLGTIDELSERLNLTKDTLYWYTSEIARNRKGNRKYLIEIPEDEE